MPRANWNGAVLAEPPEDRVEIVEGNVYVPPDTVNRQHLQPSAHHTVGAWKGTASDYDVVVDGQVNRQAAWYYREPSAAASRIAQHVAFWRGVQVER